MSAMFQALLAIKLLQFSKSGFIRHSGAIANDGKRNFAGEIIHYSKEKLQ